MNRLRQLREERGMKQAELATALKTTPQSVSRYENGDRGMDYEVIDHLCNLFDCTADYLLGRSSIREQAVSEEDAELIRAYHAADLHVQAAIKTLLAPHIQVQENKQAEVS